MNFQQFTSRVVASANLAADAARQFNNFDDMAAQDEYIHSPDLNTGRSNSGATSGGGPSSTATSAARAVGNKMSSNIINGTPGALFDNTDQEVNSSSTPQTARSLLDRPPSRQQQLDFSSPPPPVDDDSKLGGGSTHSLPLAKDHTAASVLFPTLQRQSTMPLLSVVSDIVSEKKQATKSPSAKEDSKKEERLPTKTNDISDEEDDEDYDDPIMDMVRKTSTKRDEETHTTTTSVTPSPTEMKPSHVETRHGLAVDEKEPIKKNKNPNRFMEDLDTRLSMPADMEEGNTNVNNNVSIAAATDPSWGESDNKWEWMRSVARSKLTKLSSHYQTDDDRQERAPLTAAGPLSRGGTPSLAPTKDPNDDFKIVVSSSVLGTEEQAELDRIRRSTESDLLHLVLDVALNVAKQNPKGVFVAVALMLAFVFYFYTRHLANETNAQ